MSIPIRTTILTALALVAFAANSLLCRMALRDFAIDPAGFSAVRLATGAAMLWLVAVFMGRRRPSWNRGNWLSPLLLFAYAAAFSFAYVTLSVGTGALILFGAVQGTMILAGLLSGERPHALQWGGMMLAAGGLVYLVSPGLTAPSPGGSTLMAIAGVTWGFYSLRGRGTTDPIAATVDNFFRALPFAAVLSLVALPWLHATPRGLLLAAISGAITSGLGYVLWYAALRGLSATRAALVQLATPVFAAFGALPVLGEEVSLRLIISTVAILGGIGVALRKREHIVRYMGGR
ncbi:MAG: DMT family transporter [Bacteroidota bacterium]